jgi:salt-stress induced protein
MSLVNIALASCVTMCLQSYFAKYQGIEELAIQVDSNYEEGHFTLAIHLPKDLILENEQELLAFVDNYCRVKKLFREDIKVDISLAE